jgi:hypothetical protein
MKLVEIYVRNRHREMGSSQSGKDIAARTGARGIGLAAKKDDESADYHREQIAEIKAAIAKNPEWAKEMLPKMQARLAKHEATLAALSK